MHCKILLTTIKIDEHDTNNTVLKETSYGRTRKTLRHSISNNCEFL